MSNDIKCNRCGKKMDEQDILYSLCGSCDRDLTGDFNYYFNVEYTNEDDLHDSGIGFDEARDLPELIEEQELPTLEEVHAQWNAMGKQLS